MEEYKVFRELFRNGEQEYMGLFETQEAAHAYMMSLSYETGIRGFVEKHVLLTTTYQYVEIHDPYPPEE